MVRLHPLLIIALCVVVFLEIHPFQDGNGPLSRVLAMLLLLQAGYAYVPYSPLESVIEFKRDVYHQALCELSRFVPSVVAARPDRGVPPAATPRHHAEMTGRSEPSTLASPASST